MPVRPQSEVNEVERTYTLIQYTRRPATRILHTVVLTGKKDRVALEFAILTRIADISDRAIFRPWIASPITHGVMTKIESVKT